MVKDFIKEGSPEWESICEQCGICCLQKFCDSSGRVFLTNIRCAALDKCTHKCRCYDSDFKSRDNGCENCFDLDGLVLNRDTLNNDYAVPSFCPYAQKFCENDAIKKSPKKRPEIDWSKTVSETEIDDGSVREHIIPGSQKYFKYNPHVNEKIREAMRGFYTR